LSHGKIAFSLPNSLTHTVGLSRIRLTAMTRPVKMLATAPAVESFLQNTESTSAGKFALAAMAKAKPTRNATLILSKKSQQNREHA
jgi:hypothetical protein